MRTAKLIGRDVHASMSSPVRTDTPSGPAITRVGVVTGGTTVVTAVWEMLVSGMLVSGMLVSEMVTSEMLVSEMLVTGDSVVGAVTMRSASSRLSTIANVVSDTTATAAIDVHSGH
jgi:hypothetical protein